MVGSWYRSYEYKDSDKDEARNRYTTGTVDRQPSFNILRESYPAMVAEYEKIKEKVLEETSISKLIEVCNRYEGVDQDTIEEGIEAVRTDALQQIRLAMLDEDCKVR